jgi:hypothetical protein
MSLLWHYIFSKDPAMPPFKPSNEELDTARRLAGPYALYVKALKILEHPEDGYPHTDWTQEQPSADPEQTYSFRLQEEPDERSKGQSENPIGLVMRVKHASGAHREFYKALLDKSGTQLFGDGAWDTSDTRAGLYLEEFDLSDPEDAVRDLADTIEVIEQAVISPKKD